MRYFERDKDSSFYCWGAGSLSVKKEHTSKVMDSEKIDHKKFITPLTIYIYIYTNTNRMLLVRIGVYIMTSCKKLSCATLLLFIALQTFAVDLVKSDYDALESTIRQYAPELLSRPSVKKLLNPLEWGDVNKLVEVKVNNPIVDKMKKLLDLTTFYSYEANKAKERIKDNQMWKGMGDFSYYFSLSAQEIFLRQFIAFECPNEYNAAVAKKEAEKAQEEKEYREQELAKKKNEDDEFNKYLALAKADTEKQKSKAKADCNNFYLSPDILAKVRKVLQKQQKLLSKGKPCAFKDGDFFDKFTTFIDTLTADKVIELSYRKDFMFVAMGYGTDRVYYDSVILYARNRNASDADLYPENFVDSKWCFEYFFNEYSRTVYTYSLRKLLSHFEVPLTSDFLGALDWGSGWDDSKLKKLDDDLPSPKDLTTLPNFTPMAFYLFYYYLDLLKQQEGTAQ